MNVSNSILPRNSYKSASPLLNICLANSSLYSPCPTQTSPTLLWKCSMDRLIVISTVLVGANFFNPFIREVRSASSKPSTSNSITLFFNKFFFILLPPSYMVSSHSSCRYYIHWLLLLSVLHNPCTLHTCPLLWLVQLLPLLYHL